MHNPIDYILQRFGICLETEAHDAVFRYKIAREVTLLLKPFMVSYGIDHDDQGQQERNQLLFDLIFEEYEYLKTLISIKVSHHQAFQKQFYTHFAQFANEILERNVSITHIGLTLADPHRSGMVNLFIHLSNGSQWIYKPRTSANEAYFQTLMKMVYERTGLDTNVFAIHNFDDFSFCEFVSHNPCKSMTDIQEFYRRTGLQLAMLWYFGASDINHENIIAHGRFPVIVDLEVIAPPGREQQHYAPAHCLNESVLATLFLPRWVRTGDGQYANMSGLSETRESMNYLYDSHPSAHMPYLHGMRHSCKKYLATIQQGFDEACKLIVSPDGDLQAAINQASFVNRIILQPTSYYRRIFEVLNQPENLVSEHRQRQVIERMIADTQPVLLDNEVKGLLERDVPIYHAYYNSLDLHYVGGVVTDFFYQTSKERLDMAAERMAPASVRLQKKLIDLSVWAYDPVFFAQENEQRLLPERADQRVHLLVESLIGQLVHLPEGLFWLGKKSLGQGFYDVRHTGIDLLSGNGGIVFSLLLAYHFLDQPVDECLWLVVEQDLNYIQLLRADDRFKHDAYLATHARFYTELLACRNAGRLPIGKLTKDFFEALNSINKPFVEALRMGESQQPIPDLQGQPIEKIIPYILGLIRSAKPGYRHVTTLALENLKIGMDIEPSFENGLSGLLCVLVLLQEPQAMESSGFTQSNLLST